MWKGNVESDRAVQTAEDLGGTVSHTAKPPEQGGTGMQGQDQAGAMRTQGQGLGYTEEPLVSGFASIPPLLTGDPTPLRNILQMGCL